MTPLRTILLMLVVSALLVLAQVLTKLALNSLTHSFNFSFLLSRQIWSLFFSKYFIGALLVMGMAAFLWFYILQRAELSLVYPLVSFSYILMALIAHYFLGEKLTLQKLLGILLICLGMLILFGKNAPPAQTDDLRVFEVGGPNREKF